MMVVLPVRWSMQRRVTRMAWAAWGKDRLGRMAEIFMWRISRRAGQIGLVG